MNDAKDKVHVEQDEMEIWAAELKDIEWKLKELMNRRDLLRQVLDARPALKRLRETT